MAMDVGKALALTAAGGLIVGLAACGEKKAAEEPSTDGGEEAEKADADCCKGKNDCKGQGNCKVDGGNACAGKNDCKGQGGCAPADCK